MYGYGYGGWREDVYVSTAPFPLGWSFCDSRRNDVVWKKGENAYPPPREHRVGRHAFENRRTTKFLFLPQCPSMAYIPGSSFSARPPHHLDRGITDTLRWETGVAWLCNRRRARRTAFLKARVESASGKAHGQIRGVSREGEDIALVRWRQYACGTRVGGQRWSRKLRSWGRWQPRSVLGAESLVLLVTVALARYFNSGNELSVSMTTIHG